MKMGCKFINYVNIHDDEDGEDDKETLGVTSSYTFKPHNNADECSSIITRWMSVKKILAGQIRHQVSVSSPWKALPNNVDSWSYRGTFLNPNR